MNPSCWKTISQLLTSNLTLQSQLIRLIVVGSIVAGFRDLTCLLPCAVMAKSRVISIGVLYHVNAIGVQTISVLS
jgi:hypothetical protein